MQIDVTEMNALIQAQANFLLSSKLEELMMQAELEAHKAKLNDIKKILRSDVSEQVKIAKISYILELC